jgi:GxxExxY protein
MPVCRQGRKENDISYDIRGAAFKIHNELGPGLLESVYETALSYELELMGYTIRRQVGIPGSTKK